MTATRYPAAGPISKLGSSFITVGDGGAFANIDAALAHIETLTGMVQVSGTTGTVTATAEGDKIIGSGTNFLSKIRAGDLVRFEDDGISPYTFYKPNIYFPVYGEVLDDTHLTIGTGFVGVGGAGKAWELWRPNQYTLFLFGGNHTITGSYSIPNGMNLTIRGQGKRSTILNNESLGIAVSTAKAGYLNIESLTLGRVRAGIKTMFLYPDSLDITYINFSMENVHVEDWGDGTGNMLALRACSIHVTNVSGSVYAGLGNFESDELIVSGLHFYAYSGGADICVFTDIGSTFPGADPSGTKTKTISGISATREVALITGGGALIEIQSLTSNRTVDVTNVTIRDMDQQGSSAPHCMLFSGAGTGTLNLRNAIIQETNGAVGEGGISGGEAGDVVYMYGVYGDAGAAVTTEGAATFVKVY